MLQYDGEPKSKICVTMTADERRIFGSKCLSVFEWDHLDKDEACQLAVNLNTGVHMNVGERVKLLMGLNTARSMVLSRLYNSADFQSIKDRAREKDLKIFAKHLRRILDPSGRYDGIQVQYESLKNFYLSDELVDAADAKQGERLLQKMQPYLVNRQQRNDRLLERCIVACMAEGCDVDAVMNDITKDPVDVVIARNMRTSGV